MIEFHFRPWSVYETSDIDRGSSVGVNDRRGYPVIPHLNIPKEVAQLISAAPDLLEALRMLHDETADYVRLNNLGDPWHNQSMKLARAALAKAEGKKA